MTTDVKAIREWLEDAENYRCQGCGNRVEPCVGSWRWNGTTWEHICSGDPQAGYTIAERFEPTPEDIFKAEMARAGLL